MNGEYREVTSAKPQAILPNLVVYILSYSHDSLSSPSNLDNVPTFTMALREYPQGSKILASRVAPGKRSHSPIDPIF